MKTNIQYRVRSSKIKIFPSLNQNFQRFQVSLNVDCSTRKDRDIYIYTYIPREMCTSWSQDIACRIGNRRRTSRRPAYQEAWTCRVDFSGRRSGSRPTFPLNRSNLTNLREKSRLFSPRFNIIRLFFIKRVDLSRKRKKKKIGEFLKIIYSIRFVMNLLLQGDHLSVNGFTYGDMMK